MALQAAEAAATLSRLTGRESEVLELLEEGLTARQIAQRLVLSVRTVESHMSKAYRKLGVRTREDATREFRRLGRAARVGLGVVARALPQLY